MFRQLTTIWVGSTSDLTILELNIVENLRAVIEKVGHYLPTQSPISNFIHINLLHQFEDQYFYDGIEQASDLYGANPYFSEQRYQAEYQQGRITQSDINHFLGKAGVDAEPWLFGFSKRKLFRTVFLSAPPALSPETLRWRLTQKKQISQFLPSIYNDKVQRLVELDKNNITITLLEKLKDISKMPSSEWAILWPQCAQIFLSNNDSDKLKKNWNTAYSVGALWMFSCHIALELLKYNKLENGNIDASALHFEVPEVNSIIAKNYQEKDSIIQEIINPYLIKFISGFLDLGLAHLKVIDNDEGLLKAFIRNVKMNPKLNPIWLKSIKEEYQFQDACLIISSILERRNIKEEEVESYLLMKAIALKGWAGMIYRTEKGFSGLNKNVSLEDFLAVRLILEESAIENLETKNFITQEHEDLYLGNQSKTFLAEQEICAERTLSYHLFSTFQLFGSSASQLLLATEPESEKLKLALQHVLSPRTRLRIWHKAYEWNLYSRVISAITTINSKPLPTKIKPKCQMFFCLDDREESLRRYVEEISKEYETFGTAGFFGVDAEFYSLYEKPAAFCPVNVVPSHKVRVVPKKGSEGKVAGLARLKQLHSDFEIILESQSRTLLRGWFLAVGGILALFPLFLTTIFPRFTHKAKAFLKEQLVNHSEESALVYSQSDKGGDSTGFTLEEMAHRVKTLLRSAGVEEVFAPLILIVGHGSLSSNNPYRAAYDCAACGGRPSRLNPRAICLMANRKDVRNYLSQQGFVIPDNVHFVGAYHNTCTEEIEYFDLSSIPDSHQKMFEQVRRDLNQARALNALERCRRFDEVEILDKEEALAHVEARAYHIAQPRPEYGHATTAVCFVGRREYTKRIFFDRRMFLVSYDKTIDSDLSLIQNSLRAAIPVGMGISLDYYFSSIDNQKLGAGSKLPLNVTSLIGLMTGYCSDLRTGLPQQMVDIHEPVRLLFIVDLEADKLIKVIESEEYINKLVKNHWVSLASYNSETNEVLYFTDDGIFEKVQELTIEPHAISSSTRYVVGKRKNLDFVEIQA